MKELSLLYDYNVIYKKIILPKALCYLIGYLYMYLFAWKWKRDFMVFDK